VGTVFLFLAIVITTGVYGSVLIIFNQPVIVYDEDDEYDESEDIPGNFDDKQLSQFRR